MTALHIKHGWFFAIFLFCAALVLANVVHYIIFRIARRKAAQTHIGPGWGLQKHLGRPARAVFFITCALIVLPFIPDLSRLLSHYIRHGLILALVAALGWFAVGCIYAIEAAILRRYDLGAEDNVQARRIHTQFQLFRRMAITFVIVVDAGALLWTFNSPTIWHYGSGLLASAGVASSSSPPQPNPPPPTSSPECRSPLTQPIRIDDENVVRGEWGRIEEINSAYVVIKVWDLRRLVVPLSHFIENPFQNWTRESSDIMGTAFLYVDYSIPVEVLRKQLNTIVQSTHLWDHKVCGLQVTNLTDRVMELLLPRSAFPQLRRELRPPLPRPRTTRPPSSGKITPNAFPVTRSLTRPDSTAPPPDNGCSQPPPEKSAPKEMSS